MASRLDPCFKAHTYITDDRNRYIKTKAAAEILSQLEGQTSESVEGGAAEEITGMVEPKGKINVQVRAAFSTRQILNNLD